MKDISDIRGEIDRIDDEIASRFKRRLEIMADVAASKAARGAPITDPARERAILSRVTEDVGPAFENAARLFFSTLFGISKARQRTMLGRGSALIAQMKDALAKSARFPTRAMVACQGTEGAYAQQATTLLFPLPTILYLDNAESVFEGVERGMFAYGIVPIENPASGAVAAVYDLMVRHHCHIARSIRLRVDHVLLAPHGVKLEDVREVCSHPHALAQCSGFLRAHPSIRAVPGANTAVAARALAQSDRRDAAVIASRACAELYGLDILAENLSDAVCNYTRFVCIARDLEVHPDATKFSVMFTLSHRAGALNAVIAKFAAIDVNLTEITSHPVPGMDLEYQFVLAFEAPAADENVLALLAELSEDPDIRHFTLLGVYAEK